jgi:hypothetical protein
MRHVVVPRQALLPWALALANKPKLAVAAAALGLAWDEIAAQARHKPAAPRARASVPPPRGFVRRHEFAVLALESRARTARQIADAATRAHAPALLLTRRGRRFLAAACVAGTTADWLTRRPALDPLRFGALRLADDLAYATGVWAGCVHARTLAPLVPAMRERAHEVPHETMSR